MIAGANEARRVGTMWCLGQHEPIPAVQPRVEASFQQVNREAAKALSLAMRDGAAGPILAEIRRRLAAGRRCYAAWVGGQVAAYGWVSFDLEYIGEIGLHFHLAPGEAYIWDCATVPAFRQNHLFSALLVFMAAELRAEGVQRIWIGADTENEPSQRGIDRAGFWRVADLVVKRSGSAQDMRHDLWVEGYPGVPDALVSAMEQALLGDVHRSEAV